MDWLIAAAEWKSFRRTVSAHWEKLTETQLQAIAGRRAQLGEQLCLSYGFAPAQAEHQICRFEAENDGADRPSGAG